MRPHRLFLIPGLFLSHLSTAQNFVPNWDFENMNACPSTLSTISYSNDYSNFPAVASWTNPVKQSSPDYLNGCTNSAVSTPNGVFGYQLPHSGAGYAGIVAFQGKFSGGTLSYDYREYLQTQLLQPLKAGKQYCVSFYVSPTISPNFTLNNIAIDDIGINFSVPRPTDTINRHISLPCHIQNTKGNYLTDTAKWYKISGVYTALGGEQWLTLGSFKQSTPPAFIPLFPATPNPNFLSWTYLFIDDVSVYEILPSDTSIRTSDSFVCKTSGLNIPLSGAANALNYTWQDGSTSVQFLAQDTGTYWCAAQVECGFSVDTFHIKYAPFRKLDLGKDSVNCLGEPVALSANHNYDSYLWNTGSTFSTTVAHQSGMYILTVNDTCGTQKDTVNVIIQPPTPPPLVQDTVICQNVSFPELNVTGINLKWYYSNFDFAFLQQPEVLTNILGKQTLYVSQTVGYCESPRAPVNITIRYAPAAEIGTYYVFCTGADTLLGHEYPEVSYLWSTGETSCCILPHQTGTYKITISNECGTSSDTAFVEVFSCDECLFLPNAFTPNGDGDNDIFQPVIKCPVYNYRLQIYNRWGELLFRSSDPLKGWNGNNKGDKADLGVYVYTVEYNSLKTRKRKTLKGNVLLIR